MTPDFEARVRRVRKIVAAAGVVCGLSGVALLVTAPRGLLEGSGFAVGGSLTAIVVALSLIRLLASKPGRAVEIASVGVLFVAALMPLAFAETLDQTRCLNAFPDVVACVEALPLFQTFVFLVGMLTFVTLISTVLTVAIPAMVRRGMIRPTIAIGSEMEKLARLHGEGALTDAEFALAKRRLLGD